jgi:hypothetical protein
MPKKPPAESNEQFYFNYVWLKPKRALFGDTFAVTWLSTKAQNIYNVRYSQWAKILVYNASDEERMG